MKPFNLLSVDLNGDNLGIKQPRSESRRKEREKEFELYCVAVDENIRIRPVLPEAGQDLGVYLKKLGCPAAMADAVVKRLRAIRGYKHDVNRSFIGASVFEEDFMEIVLIEASGRVTKLHLQAELKPDEQQ